jgi:transcription-repair coupling factor (superfamily II helicase)
LTKWPSTGELVLTVETKGNEVKQELAFPWDKWVSSDWWREMAEQAGRYPYVRWAPAASASWPFMAACFKTAHPERPLVIVTPGLRLQESMHQDVTTWIRWLMAHNPQEDENTPCFYPAWEHLPHEAKLPHADVISERLETLGTLLKWPNHSQKKVAPVIITSIQALMQRTFDPAELRLRIKTMRVGDIMDPLDLVEWLEDQAYEPEAKVTQKGELALRGGILDVFPMNSPWPVRLEFFGDELESIRTFNPETQLTREQTDVVHLTPGGELGLIKSQLEQTEGNPSGSALNFFNLLDYLPASTCMLEIEPKALQEAAEHYMMQVPEDDPFFLDWHGLQDRLERGGCMRAAVEETDTEWLGSDGMPRETLSHSGAVLHPDLESMEIYRPMGEQRPAIHIAEKQRLDFLEQMHRWLRKGHDVLVVCNNEGERQRFQEIWQESGLDPQGLYAKRLHLLTGSLGRGFVADSLGCAVVTDAEIFGRYKVQRPRRMKSPHATAAKSILQIDFSELEEGDYVVHLQHGIGRYTGLQRLPPVGAAPGTEGPEYLVIEYACKDVGAEAPRLYVPLSEAHLVSKYVGAGKGRPQLHVMGGKRWQTARNQAEKAVRDLAGELLQVQAARASESGYAFEEDTPWQREFESAFLYEETLDQVSAISASKQDMERPKPMDRLICGDVGFGKTEVAIRAAFKAVMGGRQVAILVPTTVLAQQHYNTFADRMADYPVRVELLSRFQKAAQARLVIQDLARGSVDIVIGTHKLIQKNVTFKDLGLVIIDEEQRFGVTQKEKFKLMRKLVDVLTLSATPIPRTLHLALMGARDMSTIETPPQDRLPVETIVIPYDEEAIQNALRRELNRQGQVFFLHNRVNTIGAVAQRIQRLAPDARIVVGHGQMEAKELETVMRTFMNGEADILVSTTIIESGIDIPNANTIIIDRADRFGLSELYQLRGRVGRYKHQAYAYLLLPRHAGVLTDARKRLSAMKQYSKLGSGFKIAMRDLEIRGAGNLLGAQQSGHITAIGFDLYCQLLKQSISCLRGEKVAPRVEIKIDFDFLMMHPGESASQSDKNSVNPKTKRNPELVISVPRETAVYVETPGDTTLSDPDSGPPQKEAAYLPMDYVTEPQQRIEIYRKIAEIDDTESLQALKNELKDRYGPLSEGVERLMLVSDLKWKAFGKGISEIATQGSKLKIMRHGQWIMMHGKFPRLIRKRATARLNEIHKMLQSL